MKHLVLLLFFIAAPASAQTTAMFAAPAGLTLMHAVQPTTVYSGTSAAANWKVAQWGIPAELPPFNGHQHTENADAGVSYAPDGSFKIYQNGKKYACMANYPNAPTQKIAVKESDLFVSPMRRLVTGVPLASMASLTIGGTFTAWPGPAADALCGLNATNILVAVILVDQNHDTFFYQLSLDNFNSRGGVVMAGTPNAAWFATGVNRQNGAPGNFGYGDHIWNSYGLKPMPIYVPTAYKLNILPQLLSVLHAGAAYQMQQDTSQWYVAGWWVGQALWGHVTGEVKVANPSLDAVMK